MGPGRRDQNDTTRGKDDMGKPLIELPTDQLLAKFGSGGHKPGSGSAAALLGLVAWKLIQTVVTLTAMREQCIDVQTQSSLANHDIVAQIEPVLMPAVQEDSDAFDRTIQIRQERDSECDSRRRRQLSAKALNE
jgi:formiminotetrahydrofolate cyclodeaminase